jgi:hypothetical protein
MIPKADYAGINTQKDRDIMRELQSAESKTVIGGIDEVEKNSANYSPPVFFVLANILFKQGDKDGAIFWFNAGRLRADFDAIRCTDVSARSAVHELVLSVPDELRKSQFDDVGKLQSITRNVIKWDETTPHDYDPRWINLFGMNAVETGLGVDKPSLGDSMSVPEASWQSLAQQNRDAYTTSLDVVIAKYNLTKSR